MSEVHKLVCDVCKTEKDLLSIRFGGVDTWQKLQEYKDVSNHCIGQMKRVDVCGFVCLSAYLEERKTPNQ